MAPGMGEKFPYFIFFLDSHPLMTLLLMLFSKKDQKEYWIQAALTLTTSNWIG